MTFGALEAIGAHPISAGRGAVGWARDRIGHVATGRNGSFLPTGRTGGLHAGHIRISTDLPTALWAGKGHAM
jgi:hypothetical protein